MLLCFLFLCLFLIKNLYERCNEGGVIIIVDKEEQPEGYYGTALHRLTLKGKVDMGVNFKDIIQKEMSLQGVQRPVKFNDLLSDYKHYSFFRFGEFHGVLIEKRT